MAGYDPQPSPSSEAVAITGEAYDDLRTGLRLPVPIFLLDRDHETLPFNYLFLRDGPMELSKEFIVEFLHAVLVSPCSEIMTLGRFHLVLHRSSVKEGYIYVTHWSLLSPMIGPSPDLRLHGRCCMSRSRKPILATMYTRCFLKESPCSSASNHRTPVSFCNNKFRPLMLRQG